MIRLDSKAFDRVKSTNSGEKKPQLEFPKKMHTIAKKYIQLVWGDCSIRVERHFSMGLWKSVDSFSSLRA